MVRNTAISNLTLSDLEETKRLKLADDPNFF
jgi:hypothetical protein